MGEWKEYILEDLGKIVTGKTPPAQIQDAYGGKVPFITPKDMDERKCIEKTERFLSISGVKAVKNSLIPAKSIAVSCIGSDMGKAILTVTSSVTNQQINSIVVNDGVFDPEFVYYNMSLRQDELKSIASGSATPILNKGHFSKLKIMIPDFATQKSVASILSSLDDKIELNRKMNETLEEMARTIFKSWFVDFDPVLAKARGEKPAGMPDEIADLFPSEFVHSDQLNKPIPKGWEVKPLKNLIDFNPSRQIRSGSIAPYVKMSSLPERGMSIKDFYKREFKSGTKFINGDTLFARITPCLENGKTAYVDCLLDGEVAWGSTEFIVMRSKADIGNYFSYLVARSDWFRAVAIASMTGSSGRQRASKEALEELLIAAPCLDVFKAFNRIIEEIPEKIKSAHSENQTLAELRDSLLPKLISGEIEV